MEKIYLNVPYSEKDDAKRLGARWDSVQKRWYFTDRTQSVALSKWIPKENPIRSIQLSDEQMEMIRLAKEGKNVLVDACIGSGKTTAIQALCNEMPDKKILYLTYNRLLKEDAQGKIRNSNVFVTNYHGFASSMLYKAKIRSDRSDCIQIFLSRWEELKIPKYDVLILDEYQDIETEIADMLLIIRESNPKIKIVAVGDMSQKIYDKTTLDVISFIESFLGSYVMVDFTKCFRLSEQWTDKLGFIWNKNIKGVNNGCSVEYMTISDIVKFLSQQTPSDILCLGSRNGNMSYVLNELETKFPEKFNKSTVYASIRDEDRENVKVQISNAIFTTYDSSKGLEKRFCVIFDFTQSYWHIRYKQPNTKYEILRNIFCVAASRGKEKVIFAIPSNNETVFALNEPFPKPDNRRVNYKYNVSDMYSFKYKEDVEECFGLIRTKKIKMKDDSIIDVRSNDGLIDLSPCIGILQEASYFSKYNIDDEIEFSKKAHDELPSIQLPQDATFEDKVLLLTAIETGYKRYVYQVKTPFVDNETLNKIHDRLSTALKNTDEVQLEYEMSFRHKTENLEIDINGRIDVLNNDTVYELKFVSELSHEHFLQCATYLVMSGIKQGILWNIKNNDMYKITVPNKKKFITAMLNAISKHAVESDKMIKLTA